MKKCKENYIKILEAMCDNSYDIAKLFEGNGNVEMAQRKRAEAGAYQMAIWILSNYNNSFEEYGKIFFPDEFKK